MKIAYNPLGSAAYIPAADNKDLIFDLVTKTIYAKGVPFDGTKYSTFKKHTSPDNTGGSEGLVPIPSYSALNNRLLREDGLWVLIAGVSAPDDTLSLESTNSVENKVITKKFNEIIALLLLKAEHVYKNVVVNGVLLLAQGANDTLTIIQGDGITLTPNSDNKSITISTKALGLLGIDISYSEGQLIAKVANTYYTRWNEVFNWYQSVTEEDTDLYINKWQEIVDFLNNVQLGTNILDEFVTRKTDQTIIGTKTFSLQIISIVAEGTAPFVVDSSTRVLKLNADMVDDYHIRKWFNNASDIDNSSVLWLSNGECSDIPSMSYSALINVIGDTGRRWQIWNSRNNHQLYWRPELPDMSGYAPEHILLDSLNYKGFIEQMYWANVPISATSSTITSPTFANATMSGILTFTTAGNTAKIKFLNGEIIDGYGNIKLGTSSQSWNIFLKDGTRALSVYDSGNVGIGTTDPKYKLDVNGSIKTSGFFMGESLELSYSTPFIDFHFNNSTADYTSRIIEESSGELTCKGKWKVGGATTLCSTLSVQGTGTFNNQIISNVANGTAPLVVSSTTKVVNLNADKLDGYEGKDFMHVGTWNTVDNQSGNVIIPFLGKANPINSSEHIYGSVLQWTAYLNSTPGVSNNSWYYLLWGVTSYDRLYFRKRTNTGSWSEARALAFTTDIPKVTDYYWANVPVSSTSNDKTTPTFGHVSIKGSDDSGLNLYTSAGYTRIRFYNASNVNNATIHYFGTAYGGYNFAKDSLNVNCTGLVTLGGWNNPTLVVSNNTTTSNSDGKVGIGTTAPSRKLDVHGDAKVCGTLHVGYGLPGRPSASTLGNALLCVGNFADKNRTTFSYGTAFWTEDSGYGYILQGRGDGTASTYPLILQVLGGNVGIGTLTPTERLLVNGNIKIQGTSNTSTKPDIYLGHYTSWAGGTYPTLMSGYSSKWIMHFNPHICRSTSTDMPGSNIRMESINKHYFDVSVGHDGLDTFKVRYDNSKNVLTISNTGQVNLINAIVFTGSVGSGAGTYLAGTRTDGLFLAANESGKKLYLESTYLSCPYFRNQNGDYAIWHAGNDGSGSGLDADTVDGIHASEFALRYYTLVLLKAANSYTRVCTISESLSAGVSCLVNIRAHYSSTVHNVTFLCTATYSSRFNIIELSNAHHSSVKIRIGSSSSYGNPLTIDVTAPSSYAAGLWYYITVIPLHQGCSISGSGAQDVSALAYSAERLSTTGGAIALSGVVYAAHFYENSDIKLKKNIKNISSSDNIPILKEFDWKEDESHSYGLIAQELEEMGYPELVSEGDGYKTVNYSAALSLIVGKLQAKIKELEKEIENLKNKN